MAFARQQSTIFYTGPTSGRPVDVYSEAATNCAAHSRAGLSQDFRLIYSGSANEL